MLKIGEFSRLSRISIRMLRYYDEMDLLQPALIAPDSGYRYYSEEQLIIAGRITALKDMGFGLSAIAHLLACDDLTLLKQSLLLKQAELQEEQQKTSQRLRLLETAIQRLGKDEAMKYDVTLKSFPERYAATVRMCIPNYQQEGRLWSILMEETKPLKLKESDPCYCCAVFHDQEFKETDVDVEVYKTVTGSYANTEHVIFRTLPQVTVASAVCKGSYDQMNHAMAAVAQWVTDNGYAFSGPAFLIYHVSPHETADADEFVTEICYPVQKN